MLLFPKKKEPYLIWYFFPLVLFPSIRLNVSFPQLPEVECLKSLEIRNPWGKVMEISGLTF